MAVPSLLRWAYVCLVFLLGDAIVQADQESIDYIADNLNVRYNVLSNFGSNGETHDIQLILHNSGSQAIANGSQPWQLHFCHVHLIDPYNIDDGGVELGDSGLVAFHVSGCMHMIQPNLNFAGLHPSQNLSVTTLGQHANIARTDMMPNWYVVDEDSEPRVVRSTADPELGFVGPYDTPEKWKRYELDNYNPYTGPQRYLAIDYDDIGPSATQVIPTLDQVDLNPDLLLDLGLGSWAVVLVDETLAFEAQYLADKLGMEVVDPGDAPFIRHVSLSLNASLSSTSEYYRLAADQPSLSISIQGTDPAGAFYGIQTLISLSETAGTVPHGLVTDSPRFHYRGMHIDVGRHFYAKEAVLRLLEVMVTYKLNKLHLHLTDDEGWRLEIPGIEELTEIGARQCHDPTGDSCIGPQLGSGPTPDNDGTGHYTVGDYRDILTYAASRHIQVIPEFDMPGHAYAAVNAMLARYRKSNDSDYILSDPDDTSEYRSPQLYTNNVVNPCVDSVYTFVRQVISEVKLMHADIQPLTVFNFGGDEVPDGAWLDSPECQEKGLVTTEQIKEWFIKNISDIAHEEGLDLAAWEDGYNKNSQEIFERETFQSPNVFSYTWDNVWEWGGGEKAYMFANSDYKVILSHATHLYYDHPYEPDPEERGYYWATRMVPTRKSFGYMPDSVYDNIDVDRLGNALDRQQICAQFGCMPLLPSKASNIVGMQGHLWGETVHNTDQLEYMIYPRLLALAERAWHKAAWEDIADQEQREVEKTADWERFANALGHKELARLDDMQIQYAVPPPGARLTVQNVLQAKADYPGMPLQCSLDDGDTWLEYMDGQIMPPGRVLVITRSMDRTRMSRPSVLVVSPNSDLEAESGAAMSYPVFTLITLLTTAIFSVSLG